MKYETIKDIEDEKFRRLTEVKRSTFMKMLESLKEADTQKKPRVVGKTRFP